MSSRSHDWGYVGSWGVIFGVHRCVRCGDVASPSSLNRPCRAAKEAER